MKTSAELKVGKHEIGYVYGVERLPSTFNTNKNNRLGSFQKLKRDMTDAEIESELNPGLCTLGDVVAFLDSAPEECKDGYSNIFYLNARVVRVSWFSYDRYWHVRAWERDVRGWLAGSRVFSPASDKDTEASSAQDLTLGPSETLPSELNINGSIYRRV